MSRVRVKICGVRTLDEAVAAIRAGADALGFNFWPRSPRYVTAEVAREIARSISPLVTTVGVFVNEEQRAIEEAVARVGLTAVQLHGDETPEFCARLSVPRIIKAFRVGDNFSIQMMRNYSINMALLDSGIRGSYGGTGKSFDWRVAIEAKKIVPLILAGGLTAENVAEAINRVRPHAIDVCSGVEAGPGRKDLKKLTDFMAAVAQANAAIMNEDI